MEIPPNHQTNSSKLDSFVKIVKGLFFLFLVLQLAPFIFSSIKNIFEDAVNPKVQVGMLSIPNFIADSSFYVQKIDSFSKNSDIKGLIIKINSPGGYPGSAQAIFNELKKFKKKKPIVAVVENICASGAYYIASAGNKIVCNPSSLIGGIGVFLELPNVKELLNSWKIKIRYIQSGAYKTSGSPFSELSEEEVAHLQNVSDDSYKQFVKDIASSRRISEKEYEKWAEGKVFTGNQALTLKLVDNLGSLQDGISEFKKLANIDEQTEIKLISPKKPSNFARLLGTGDDYETDTESSSFANTIASFANQVYNQFLMYQKQPMPTLS